MNIDRQDRLALIALAAGVLSIGFSPIFILWAGVPGPIASFYRVAIASAFLAWPFLLRLRRGTPVPSRGLALAILGGGAFALDTAAWASGVMLSGAVNPTLLANTAPLWVGLGAWLLFRERLRPVFLLGLALAMAGASFVLGMDALRSIELGLGSALGLLAGVFYAGYFLVTQRARQHLDALTYFWLSTLSATLFLLVINLGLGNSLGGYSTRAYISLLGLGIVTQAIGWLLINYAQGHLPASVVAPSTLGQPVVVALVAGPLVGERIDFWQVLGGVAVLMGMILVHRSRLAIRSGEVPPVKTRPALGP